jgi:hypothetical protein
MRIIYEFELKLAEYVLDVREDFLKPFHVGVHSLFLALRSLANSYSATLVPLFWSV